jgi:hypothetical protein
MLTHQCSRWNVTLSASFMQSRETLLCVVQGANIAAIVTTIILVRRSNSICPYHLKLDLGDCAGC